MDHPIFDLTALNYVGNLLSCPSCGHLVDYLLAVAAHPNGRPRRDAPLTTKLLCASCASGHRSRRERTTLTPLHANQSLIAKAVTFRRDVATERHAA